MTDEEWKARAGIEKTLAAIALAGDARKADAYAGCFAEDGVLDLSSGGGAVLSGRDAVRAWMAGPAVIPQNSDRPAGFISHHITSCRIELTGQDRAAVRTYFLVTSPAGLDHNGYYDDVFSSVDGEWLLARRKPRTLWISPTSVLHG